MFIHVALYINAAWIVYTQGNTFYLEVENYKWTTSIAIHPPWPRFGCIGCAASPLYNHMFSCFWYECNHFITPITKEIQKPILLTCCNSDKWICFNYNNNWYTQQKVNIPFGKGSLEGGSPWKAYHCIFPWPTSEATKYWFKPKNTRYLHVITKTETLNSRTVYNIVPTFYLGMKYPT